MEGEGRAQSDDVGVGNLLLQLLGLEMHCGVYCATADRNVYYVWVKEYLKVISEGL